MNYSLMILWVLGNSFFDPIHKIGHQRVDSWHLRYYKIVMCAASIYMTVRDTVHWATIVSDNEGRYMGGAIIPTACKNS